MTKQFNSNAFFLETDRGALFCLHRTPAATHAKKTILIVPPFAEEMNKSRRMFTLLSERLAEDGYASCIFDLSGTGDSTGDFGQASWSDWQQDLVAVHEHLAATNDEIVWLGLRFGALLAATCAAATPSMIINWQTVASGTQMVTQFLRLAVAANMDDTSRVTTAELRDQLTAGQSIEVAGYRLQPELVNPIDALKLADFGQQLTMPIHWIDVTGKTNKPLSIGAKKHIDALTQAGCNVTTFAVNGEPFWSTQEIATAPAMIDQTLACLKLPA